MDNERRMSEAARYLGFGRKEPDEQTRALMQAAFENLDKFAQTRNICRVFELQHTEDGRFQIGTMVIESKSLSRNLTGCTRAALFGATLGAQTDALIRRAELTDMASAVVLQACAAAFLEEYCDECQEALAEKMAEQNLYLRPRFSPGYGDFDIRFQEPVMRMLDCAKQIGITLTDGYMMTPTKSVTAIIGISPIEKRCPPSGCEACAMKDCAYRR